MKANTLLSLGVLHREEKKMSYRVPTEHGQEACRTILYSPKAGVGSRVGLFRGMVREQEKTRGEGTSNTCELHRRKNFLDTEQWALKGALAT